MGRANSLNPQQRKFVDNIILGMLQSQAARNAGYKFPYKEARRLMRDEKVMAAIKEEQAKHEKVADISRKKVMDGLLETVQIAKDSQEPMAMVGAWREIARICGYYAPEKKQIDISVNGQVHISRLENMSDEELLKVIDGEVVEDEPALLESPVDGDA